MTERQRVRLVQATLTTSVDRGATRSDEHTGPIRSPPPVTKIHGYGFALHFPVEAFGGRPEVVRQGLLCSVPGRACCSCPRLSSPAHRLGAQKQSSAPLDDRSSRGSVEVLRHVAYSADQREPAGKMFDYSERARVQ
jgi:hypothetical protein